MTVDLFLINQNFSVDTTAESVVKTMAPDSLHPAVQGSFLHTGGELLEAPRTFLSGHAVIGPGQFWIFYILFGLIALFAIIKFYYSRDLKTLVSALGRNTSRQENESSTKAGFMVPMFLFVNFLVAMGLLLLAVNEKFHVINTENIPIFNFFLIAGLVVLGYYLFNEFTILFVGFLFGTSKQALLHAKTGSYLVYILGIILTPVLIIYFFTGLDFLLYLAGTSIVLAVLFKWTLLLRNSYSLNHYTPFHIILYLCGLEIIPIMLLIKVGMMYA